MRLSGPRFWCRIFLSGVTTLLFKCCWCLEDCCCVPYNYVKIIIKWATTWQNKQNDCAQRRLWSTWASAQSDQSSLCAQWVAKDPSFPHADSEDSDQTGRMPRLIWAFAGRTCHVVGFVMRRLKYSGILWLAFCILNRRETNAFFLHHWFLSMTTVGSRKLNTSYF